jgi:drug/metabolite transporter (DMT)-like permease
VSDANQAVDRPFVGLMLMLGAVACFPVMQSCVKTLLLDHNMSFVQATWGRYFFHLLLVPLLFPGTFRAVREGRGLGIQAARGITLFVGTCCAFLALRYLPLPQVTALSFIAPVIVTLLAALFLAESVGWRRWMGVGVGFVGVIIIVRPGDGFTPAMLLPLAMATMYAIYQALTRLARGRVTASASLFYTALTGAIFSSVLVPFWWTSPTPTGWMLLVGSAVAGGVGHWLMILAYERAQASFIAPFAYTELIWAALLGITIFGQGVDQTTMIGASIIVASGLYIAYRERSRKTKAD